MVALFVIGILLCALTADYVVQRLALRAPSMQEVADALEGIFLDASHMWIKPETGGMARVGADGVVGMLLGSPRRIDWPAKGPVERGAPLLMVHGQGRSLILRSPIAGEVVEQNTGFVAGSAPASSEAFESGWLVQLRPKQLEPHLAAMKTGSKLREWSRQEMDRLREFVLSRIPLVVVGATAADGGPLAADLASRLNDDAWCEAVRLMLGAQVLEQDERPELAIASAGGHK
ncbi:MAG TPA: hypothetical protein VF550_13665 [Polyangia bacterium]